LNSGPANLQINFLDENDNAPEFTGSRFLATVMEGQPVGTFIYQVEASDVDNDQNGIVKYRIIKVEPRSAFNLFAIDENTGIISTKQLIDRETINRYVKRFLTKRTFLTRFS